jgi:hypothetical protein
MATVQTQKKPGGHQATERVLQSQEYGYALTYALQGHGSNVS